MTHSKFTIRAAALFGALLIGSAALAVGGAPAKVIRQARTLTVCADPDNLPLSHAAGQPQGYDLEMAADIARSLGAELKVHWYASEFIGRVYRQLAAGNCDFFVGAPTDKRLDAQNPQVTLSRPYLNTGFVVVVAPQVTATTLAELKGKRIGVQMNTLADFQVFDMGHDRGLYPRQKAIFKALEKGELEAAVMWGPVFGWMARNEPGARLRVLADARPEFAFPLAVAVRSSEPELLAEVNQAIAEMGKSGRRGEILARYGFPTVHSMPASVRPAGGKPPVAKAQPAGTKARQWQARAGAVAVSVRLHFVVGGSQAGAMLAQQTSVAPGSSGSVAQEVLAEKGRSIYNGSCQKCHGRNLVSGGMVPDLRRFEGNESDFVAVVKAGRPPTAMPPWGNVYSDTEIKSIWAYVQSVGKAD
ncbi:putative Cytochrome c domain-containing protein [Rubrivivax sp. A210]|uniref:transporter substrate-binding domain-containing protein n=1 Tax=Rubrivivax sp. A210 TaxID=2772301 RepID=UPI00191B1221|nr:transporter substrate-binding domain-containing protein [Rubrivivax sp. A210]CAD5372764.1 putative Cytochrome c domain-containing protein [Rubrivivax sp. A210]